MHEFTEISLAFRLSSAVLFDKKQATDVIFALREVDNREIDDITQSRGHCLILSRVTKPAVVIAHEKITSKSR